MDIEKEHPEKSEKKEQKEHLIYWLLGIMLFIIAAFLVTNFANFGAEESGGIKYQGLTFSKQSLGEIPLYQHTYLTNRITPVTGSAITTQSQIRVNMLFRNDPRELDYILANDEIEYLPVDKRIYIAMSPSEELLCPYGTIAMGQLSSFLTQNGFKLGVGISDEVKAEEQNTNYVTCETNPDNMVLLFESGEKTEIIREGNCYTLMVSDCEILPVAEKFIIQSLIDSREKPTS